MATADNPCPRCGRPADDAYICRECTYEAALNSQAVFEYATLLPERLARHRSNYPTGNIGRSRESPLPFDPRASNLERRCLRLYADLVREYQDETPRPSNLKWIKANPERYRRREASISIADGLARLHDDLGHYLDPDPDLRYLGPCDPDPAPACAVDLYVAEDGEGAPLAQSIECPACGRTVDVNERRSYLLDRAMGHIATLKEALSLVRIYGDGEGVTYDTLRGLVRHGRLTPIGPVWAPSSVTGGMVRTDGYRIGDVMEALANTRRTKRRRKARTEVI